MNIVPPWPYIGTGRVTLLSPLSGLVEEIRYYIRDLPWEFAVATDEYTFLSNKIAPHARKRAIWNAIDELRRQKFPGQRAPREPIIRLAAPLDPIFLKVATE